MTANTASCSPTWLWQKQPNSITIVENLSSKPGISPVIYLPVLKSTKHNKKPEHTAKKQKQDTYPLLKPAADPQQPPDGNEPKKIHDLARKFIIRGILLMAISFIAFLITIALAVAIGGYIELNNGLAALLDIILGGSTLSLIIGIANMFTEPATEKPVDKNDDKGNERQKNEVKHGGPFFWIGVAGIALSLIGLTSFNVLLIVLIILPVATFAFGLILVIAGLIKLHQYNLALQHSATGEKKKKQFTARQDRNLRQSGLFFWSGLAAFFLSIAGLIVVNSETISLSYVLLNVLSLLASFLFIGGLLLLISAGLLWLIFKTRPA